MARSPGARIGRPKTKSNMKASASTTWSRDEETWMPQRNVAPRVIEEYAARLRRSW